MNPPPLIDPRLFGSMPQFFPQACEIQQLPATDEQNAIGEALVSDWATVTGLQSIPCYRSQFESRSGNEIRGAENIFTTRYFHIHLAGDYPSITDKMRATISDQYGTTAYDIRSVYSDSQRASTKLYVEVIT